MPSTEKNKDWRYRSVILTLKRWKQKGQFQKSKVILSYILSIKTAFFNQPVSKGKKYYFTWSLKMLLEWKLVLKTDLSFIWWLTVWSTGIHLIVGPVFCSLMGQCFKLCFKDSLSTYRFKFIQKSILLLVRFISNDYFTDKNLIKYKSITQG